MTTEGLRLGLLLVGALLGAAESVAAQRVVVTVAVEGGGRPLPAARVAVDSMVRFADSAGRVRFEREAGRFLIRVSALGWESDSLDLVVATDTTVLVTLEPAPTELEELIVTTTRSPRRVEDEALRVEVLDTEEIDEKQLMTPGDIVMMLNETGGVRVQVSNPSLGGAGIRIRGLAGRYTQVLADGLPLFGERIGALGPLQIPPLDLGQVEIVKGVASAWFGGSALGGVVNLISRPPGTGSSVLLNATSLGGGDATAFLTGGLGRGWGHTVTLGLHAQPRTDRDDDGWADLPSYQRIGARPRLFWRDSTGQSLLLTVGATVETRAGGTLPGRLAPDGTAYPERLATTRVDGGVVGRWRIAEGWWLLSRGSASTLRHRHRFGSVGEPDRHTTGFGEVALSGRRGEVDLVVGGAVTVDRYRSERFAAFDYRFVVPAVFAQAERSFGPATVAASARVDRHERYGTMLSPRLSTLLRVGGGWSLRGSVGGGYAGPTPFVDETERNGLSRLEPLGALRAERAVSASLDGHGTIGPVEVNASLFAVRVRDPLQAREATLGRFALVNAAGSSRSAGADVSLVVRRGALAVIGSYAFVSTSEATPDGSGRREIPLTPRHTAGLVAVGEGEWGRLGVEFYFTGAQGLERHPTRQRGEPYLVVGVLGERRFGAFSAFVNLENLTDVRQTRFDPLLRGTRAFDGSWTVDAWAPLDGRTVNGGLRWSW